MITIVNLWRKPYFVVIKAADGQLIGAKLTVKLIDYKHANNEYHLITTTNLPI